MVGAVFGFVLSFHGRGSVGVCPVNPWYWFSLGSSCQSMAGVLFGFILSVQESWQGLCLGFPVNP